MTGCDREQCCYKWHLRKVRLTTRPIDIEVPGQGTVKMATNVARETYQEGNKWVTLCPENPEALRLGIGRLMDIHYKTVIDHMPADCPFRKK